ncbi:MAG: hypothetical protein DWQ18_06805 [Crenarchaeota archaeon]|nr:MAG: hypothetical protein DWQ17_02980 [Thermoproteota archaeon]RDJ32893.1 MAG: hypothetical protein DWQ18_06805 [Thermoproteota archaeon]RDJ36025.1 MAG: hypothetical protein DWQ13_09065 [Thermoproteota archaeon]RDJ38273.1 MAG: hypothetical protein DWQ19_00370 [Thermoproteota archaeon]
MKIIPMQESEPAPNFELDAHDGSKVSLSSFKGKKNVVLCFYPKNHLFACPSKKVFKMAQSIIASYDDIVSTDSVLFAISIDTIDSQKKFVDEYEIPYKHLSDTKKDTCRLYAGLNIAGLPKRCTYIIDKNGLIRKIFRDISVESHGQEILQTLRQIADSSV